MKNILVTTDFSPNSKAGIRFAAQLSQQIGCSLTFYHVVEIMKPTSWSDKKYKSFAEEKIAENTRKIQDFLKSLNIDESVLKRSAFVVEIGTYVVPMIEKVAKKKKADFICMSTRGAGKVQKILGTHASALITTSATPVISVPSGYRSKPVKTIYYASDFAAITPELRKVTEFAKAAGAVVEVYHYDYLLHVPENRQKLEKKAAKLQETGVSFRFVRQEIEKPLSKHFRADIEKTKPSMVVLFTKQNRNWFDRLFLSSESADLAFHLNVPLLTFRKKVR